MSASTKTGKKWRRRMARRYWAWVGLGIAALALTALGDGTRRAAPLRPTVASAQVPGLRGQPHRPEPPQLRADQVRASLGVRRRQMAERRAAHVARKIHEARSLPADRQAARLAAHPLERNPPPPPRVDDVDLAAHPGE